MIKHINDIQYAYYKIITENKQNNTIITENFMKSIWDAGKSAVGTISNVVKKVGKAVGGWFVSLYKLIKFGVKALTNFLSGTYKNNPDSLNSDTNQLKTSLVQVVPFFSCLVTIPEKVGEKVHNTQFKDLKNNLKGKSGRKY